MQVIRYSEAAAFLDDAGPFLLEREARHNLPLAIAMQCRSDPARYPHPNTFAAVKQASRIIGVAVMTPPHRLQMFVDPGPAMDAVIADLAASDRKPPGVHGPSAISGAFAAAWCKKFGLDPVVRMHLRAFELSCVSAPPQPCGRMRVAGSKDLSFVQCCYRAFEKETNTAPSSVAAEELARRAVGSGRIFLWDDGGPVAQAGIMGLTPNGARIGAVYTPPAHRARGLATALVAALSQHLLDQGRKFSFLFTDLANPVSNSIYPKVGYRPFADYCDIDFQSR